MANDLLAETCLYTILHPAKLDQAAKLRGPSTFVVRQRMVAAEALFNDANRAGQDVAVLFGDATACAWVVCWARLTGISVGKSDTHYTVFPVHHLRPPLPKTKDLVLESTGKQIADGFIRPYAIVRTPRFLLSNGSQAEEQPGAVRRNAGRSA